MFGKIVDKTYVPLKTDEASNHKTEILREADAMAALEHPHILRLIGKYACSVCVCVCVRVCVCVVCVCVVCVRARTHVLMCVSVSLCVMKYYAFTLLAFLLIHH